jgi:hypothetical protein
MSLYYNTVAPHESKEVFDYTISGGEDLLIFGVDDFSQIVSWINLVDLTLEVVPTCRESLHTCLNWFGTNRERVELSLTILRDARKKLHNPLYVSLLSPSPTYRMLIERLCGGRSTFGSQHYPSETTSLSCRDFS